MDWKTNRDDVRSRERLRSSIEKLGKRLQALLALQTGLNEDVMSGKIRPARANEKNRKLSSEIEDVRKQIAELNARISEWPGFSKTGSAQVTDQHSVRQTPDPVLEKPGHFRVLVDSLKPTPIGFIVWLICFFGAIIGVLVYMQAIPLTSGLQLSVAPLSAGELRVAIKNTGKRPVLITVPRSELSALGLAVYAREKGVKKYTPVSTTGDWEFRKSQAGHGDGATGSPGISQENASVTIGPGFSDLFVLRVDRLRETGLKPDALRIAIETRGGHCVAEQVAELQ